MHSKGQSDRFVYINMSILGKLGTLVTFFAKYNWTPGIEEIVPCNVI